MQRATASLGNSVKKSSVKPFPKKVISFVGDMEKNVREVVENLNCRCGSKFS